MATCRACLTPRPPGASGKAGFFGCVLLAALSFYGGLGVSTRLAAAGAVFLF